MAYREPPEGALICEEHLRLVSVYLQVVSRYRTAQQKLEAAKPITPRREYQGLRGEVERARHTVDQAWLELEMHVTEHGCLEVSD